MATNSTQQERIARKTYHDATFLGIDGEDAVHYWSIYHQAVVVIEDGNVSPVELPVTTDGRAIETLSDWVGYTRAERGWETHRLSSGLVTDLARNQP